MKRTIALICALLPISCKETMPSDVVPFESGRWSGTFSFAADVGPITLTKSGIISFDFADTSYAYVGEMEVSAYRDTYKDTTRPSPPYEIKDSGTYKRIDRLVAFDDVANRLGAWVPSLYLSGEYYYRFENGILTITKSGPSRSCIIILEKQM